MLNFLWDNGIEHCDVSAENLMFKQEQDGSICGILNDWDLSRTRPEVGKDYVATQGMRTGTQPFMARELLCDNPPRHLKRFDFESMLYVLIWCGCCYDQPGTAEKNVLKSWCTNNFEILSGTKAKVISTVVTAMPLTQWFSPLVVACDRFRFIFKMGSDEVDAFEHEQLRRRHFGEDEATGFMAETLGGHVTFENIWTTLVEDGPPSRKHTLRSVPNIKPGSA